MKMRHISTAIFGALSVAAGVSADQSHGGGSSVVVSETTILNRVITSLNVFDHALVSLEGGHDALKNLKAAAEDLAYTLEAQTVLAHEILILTPQEAQALKPKSEELHRAGGNFLKHFAAAKGKLDSVGASPKIYYYLTFRLSKSTFPHSPIYFKDQISNILVFPFQFPS